MVYCLIYDVCTESWTLRWNELAILSCLFSLFLTYVSKVIGNLNLSYSLSLSVVVLYDSVVVLYVSYDASS